MAYVQAEKKQSARAALKKLLPAGWKWTLSRSGRGTALHSTLLFTLFSSPVNFARLFPGLFEGALRVQCSSVRDDGYSFTGAGQGIGRSSMQLLCGRISTPEPLKEDDEARVAQTRFVDDLVAFHKGQFSRDEVSQAVEAARLLMHVDAVLSEGNWDKSDIMTDYFNVGWYTRMEFGRWNAPYLCTTPT